LVDAGRRPRALIVDDNAVIGRMLGDMLYWLGVDTDELRHGRDALARLDGDDGYDLLVADLQMPESNGWDFAQAARARRPHLRVLLITGHPSVAVLERAQQAGLGLLPRPFTMKALETAVGRVLAKAGHGP
jgi:CheY-like chemotaxis protein